MITLPEIRVKNRIYTGSVSSVWGQCGTILAQCGTTLEFLSGSAGLKIHCKNSHLHDNFAENPVWGNKLYTFCHHTGKNLCFSMGYLSVSECKISPIPTVYKASLKILALYPHILACNWQGCGVRS